MATNTYPEPYRSRAGDSLVDPSTCYNRECVSYTAWKIREATGKWPKRTGDMDAKNWIYRLPSWGYKKVSAPKSGGKYVGVNTSGTYGHVVWSDGSNKITEYNYVQMFTFSERTVNAGSYQWWEIKALAKPKPSGNETWRKVNISKRRVTADVLNVREMPSTKSKIVARYKKGDIVYVKAWADVNGYRWNNYVAASGKTRYIAEGRAGKAFEYLKAVK
jgi:hypothetical protein